MAISRRPSPSKAPATAEAIDQFISGAPDAGPKKAAVRVAGIRRGNKQQISVTLHPELLVKMDAMARDTGQSRASIINMAVYALLKDWEGQQKSGGTQEH